MSGGADPAPTTYRIRGRVQGVGFRWWCKRTADELGISGAVRNLADGTVEVVASGDADALADFERRLRTGPPAALVEEVRAVASPSLADAHPGEFRILA